MAVETVQVEVSEEAGIGCETSNHILAEWLDATLSSPKKMEPRQMEVVLDSIFESAALGN